MDEYRGRENRMQILLSRYYDSTSHQSHVHILSCYRPGDPDSGMPDDVRPFVQAHGIQAPVNSREYIISECPDKT